MGNVLVGTRQNNTPDVGGLILKGYGITGNITRAEEQNVHLTIKQSFS